MNLLKTTLLFFLFCLCYACHSQDQKTNLETEQTTPKAQLSFSWQKDSALIEQLMERYSGDKPGISFIVIKEGQILAQKAYGYANLKDKTKANINSNYRTASATKQFTAMAIMLLIHQGKLSYDSKLTDVFPNFPTYGSKVSIKHLLVHRSGLVDYMSIMDKSREDQILDPEVLQMMYQQDHTEFEPGAKYQYSNSAYAVLAEVIAKVSGLSYADYMKQHVFEPLDMKHSLVYEKGVVIPNRAYGHQAINGTFSQRDQSTTSAVQGDGGVYTSVLDYYKWDQALYKHTLIPKEAFEAGLTPWYDDPKLQVQAYGNGWRIDYINGIKITHHSGHTKGFTNYTCRIPALNLSFAAFSNRNSEDAIIRLGNAIVALYSDGQLPIPADAFAEAVFDKEGSQKALDYYKTLRTEEANKYWFTENDLIILGKKLQKKNQYKEAIAIYEYNMRLYPASFLTAYELANCYRSNKETTKAKIYFKMAKDLIPALYREVLDSSNHYLKSH